MNQLIFLLQGIDNDQYLVQENSDISYLNGIAETDSSFVEINGQYYKVKDENNTDEVNEQFSGNLTSLIKADEPSTSSPDDEILSLSDGSWKCPHCDFTSDHNTTVFRHVKNIHGNTKQECTLCNRTFKTKIQLAKHIEFHQNPPECQYCGKTFMSLGGYQRHISQHEGTLQKYMCDICGLVIVNPHTFEAHMNRHNNIRPYKCEKCNRCYDNRDHLMLHLKCSKSCDGANKETFMCHLCGKAFTYKRHYKRHIMYSHREPSCKCDICGRMLKSPDCLRAHIKTHQKRWEDRPMVASRSVAM